MCVIPDSTLLAQEVFPEQFYTNGQKMDAWNRDPGADYMTTLWFARPESDDLRYRQFIVYSFDDRPGEPVYQDRITRKFIGRFDEEGGGYSMLPEEYRLTNLGDIPESAFPPPGEMPTLDDIFGAVGETDTDNDEQMMKPPVTETFPRLEDSTWESHYTNADGERVRAEVEFDGDRGTYRPQGSSQEARLADVQYLGDGDGGLVISGRWIYGGGSGFFRFHIRGDDLNRFEGNWGYQSGRVEGIWDGVRTSQ
jgi:hypothetical protein